MTMLHLDLNLAIKLLIWFAKANEMKQKLSECSFTIFSLVCHAFFIWHNLPVIYLFFFCKLLRNLCLPMVSAGCERPSADGMKGWKTHSFPFFSISKHHSVSIVIMLLTFTGIHFFFSRYHLSWFSYFAAPRTDASTERKIKPITFRYWWNPNNFGTSLRSQIFSTLWPLNPRFLCPWFYPSWLWDWARATFVWPSVTVIHRLVME